MAQHQYRDLMRRPGALPFTAAAFVGRLPISMIPLGIVLLVTSITSSYALAGAMSATMALAAAAVGPLGARLIDRLGQGRVVPALAAAQVIFLLGFVGAATNNWALGWQFALLLGAGAAAPNVGSLVRARWAHVLRGHGGLRSALALEAVLDEVVFIVGPPVVTVIALQVGEGWALVVSAALVAAGTTWLATLRATQPPPTAHQGKPPSGRILGLHTIVVFGVMFLMGSIFGSFEVTTVAFARDLGQEGLAGVLLALYAVGSLLAGLLMGAWTPRLSAGRLLPRFTLVLAVVMVPLPFVPSALLLAGTAFVAGLAVSPVLILAATIITDSVPAGRLTEALTLSISGVALGLAVASTGSGWIIDSWHPSAAYWVMVGSGVGSVLVTWPVRDRLARAGQVEVA